MLRRLDCQLEETDDAIILKAPSYKETFLLIFIPLWLLGWFYGLIAVAISAFTGTLFRLNPDWHPGALTGFSLLWATVWIFSGLRLMLVWLKMAFGLETMKFEAQSVKVSFNILGLSRTKEYPVNSIWNLRQVEPISYWKPQIRRTFDPQMQTLAFDLNNKTIRFASGISKISAEQVVDWVQKKFPHYIP